MHRTLRNRSAARSDESTSPPSSPIRALLAAVTVGALILFGGPTLAAADELAPPPAAADEAAPTSEEQPVEAEAEDPPAEETPPAEAVDPPVEEPAPPAEEEAPPAEEAAPPAEDAPPADDAAAQQAEAPAPVDCMAIPIGNDDRSARDACLAEQQAGLRSFAAAADPAPATNPDLPNSCGLDFALVLDKSGSIGDDGIADLKDAADAFTDALKDTGSEVSVTSFDQDAALLQPAMALTSANLATIQGSYGGLASEGWTNWKRGLEVGHDSFGGFSEQPVELTIVITDGNPNTVDPDEGGEFPDGSPEAVNPAILEANSIKANPSHVFVVAVGPNVSVGPIEAISGTELFTGSNISTADYMTSDNYASLAEDLQLVAKALCAGNVIIHKQVGVAFPGTPGGVGWEFSTATSDVAPTSDTTEASSQTDPFAVTGFEVVPDPPARQVTFTETPNNGSLLTGAKCGTTPDMNDAVAVPFDPAARTFTASVAKESTTHCWVLNTFAPRWLAWKTVSPADGSTVEPGQVVTYTLHAKNDGFVPVTGATLVDDLGDVLDDADLLTVVAPPLSLAGDELTWSIPTLAPGAETSISFDVEVHDDAFDRELRNVVTPSDNGRCPDIVTLAAAQAVLVDDCVTENPTPDVTIDKNVDETTLDVVTGEWSIGYTLDVENTGDVDTEYTLSDATEFGDGMTISAIEYWEPGEDRTLPGHPLTGPFAPVGEYLLGEDHPLAVGVTDSWYVRITATIDDDGLPEYGCDGEEGGGFSNTGIVTIGTGVREDEDCDAPGRLTLIKEVDNQAIEDINEVIDPDLPLALPSDWLLKAEGPVTVEDPGMSDPGRTYLVPEGWYDLSEQPNPDSDNPLIVDGTYVPGEWVCDDEDPEVEKLEVDPEFEVYVPAGGDVTCSIENTANPADLGIVKDYELSEGVEAIDDFDPDGDPADSDFWFTLTVTNHGPDVPGAMVTDTLPDTLEVLSAIEITPADPNWDASFTGNQFTAVYDGVYAADSVTEFRFQVRFLGEPVVPLPENPEVPPEPIPAEPVMNEACVEIVVPESPDDDVTAALAVVDVPSLPTNDLNPDNDCDDTTVPTKAMQANAYVQCINDVPWLYHNVMTAGPVTPSDITVTWTPDPAFYPDAVPVVTIIPWEERNGRVLWPYGEVNDEGISIAWPGWRLAEPGDVVGEGTIVDSWENMVKDSSLPSYAFADQDHPMTITFEINPSQSVLAVYPQATPACAVTREAGPLIEKTSSVTSVMPGGTFDYTLSITNPGLGATKAMELFDEIPADLKVNSITTPPAPAFPRWDDCEVTGEDSAGYGGTLHCILNGQIGGTRPDAPDVVLSVTLNPKSTSSSIVNTGEICWNDLPDDQTAPAADGAIPLDPAEQILCDDSSVTVHVPQPGAAIASTGFAGAPFIWIAAGMLLVGGMAVAYVVIRRRRTGGV
ncbi:putative repeat protein (TIGR01451 family) [Agromyces hippuratus]|uniref:Putative repeat protein (TIGR01451 family) n=1 Tax=Agromyces hippuratus TaxID=286438 RepID=A0A852WSM8_9MICO|nr:VWA domain-containing protein [Agromyces hippuratus]NYG20568.1 putative repeat protein (TIGR01451 family) [Agromyces hippuratus]